MRRFYLMASGLVLAVSLGACGDNDADGDDTPDDDGMQAQGSRCEEICAGFSDCGTTQCNCEGQTTCANADEILDHLEDCSTRPCNEQTSCLIATPPCQ
jgi:hypothetical protein